MKNTKEMIKKASLFASEAHSGHYRKGDETVPYITHPIAVSKILRENGASVETILAGILHDIIEDTEYSFKDIENRFGSSVAIFVDLVTEQEKDAPWKDRKIDYINRIEDAPFEAVFISAADKLHNLRSTLADYKKHGEEIWSIFNSKKDGQYWYYSTLIELFKERGVPSEIVEEMTQIVEELKMKYV